VLVGTHALFIGVWALLAGSLQSHTSTSRVGSRLAAKGERTLYRAVSDAELNDIAKNGLRVDPSGRGYQTEKLFTGTAQDAARQAQIAHKLSGQASTIIEARFPSSVDHSRRPRRFDGHLQRWGRQPQ